MHQLNWLLGHISNNISLVLDGLMITVSWVHAHAMPIGTRVLCNGV